MRSTHNCQFFFARKYQGEGPRVFPLFASCQKVCVLSEGEEDEGAGVPYGMGDDEGREASREEAVDEAPAAAYDSCRHDQHEVERRQMDERVAGRGSYQARVGAPARHHSPLDEAAPEDLLCRTDDEEEQDANDGRRRAALHGVDHIHLSAGAGRRICG